MRGRIRLISLDLDDTLWACPPVIRRAEQRVFDWLRRNYPLITARHSFVEALLVLEEAVGGPVRDGGPSLGAAGS